MNATVHQRALLVIDMQQGLCEGEQAAWRCDDLIRRINGLTSDARAAGVPVIFVQHESGPGYLEYGTAAWQLANGLQAGPADPRVRKTTPDAFLRTDLSERLQALGVTELVICGMHSEFCVDTTCRRALALGFAVVLVADGHSSAGNGVLSAEQVIAHHNATLSSIQSFGPRVRLVDSEALSFGN